MLVDGFCYGCRDIEKRAKATIGSPNFLPLSRPCRGPCRTAPSFWGWRHDRSPRSGCVSRFRLSAHFLGEAARSGCCRLEESPARSACDFYQQWLLPWKVVSGSMRAASSVSTTLESYLHRTIQIFVLWFVWIES